MLVYGRIAEMRIFASKPPFWRKLIAVAQASLIERCIHTARCDLKGLCDWANQVGAFTSHAQLLATCDWSHARSLNSSRHSSGNRKSMEGYMALRMPA